MAKATKSKNAKMEDVDFAFSVRSYLTDLFNARYAKGQKTDWITDLLSFSDSFHEAKLSQIIMILARGNAEKPVYIGELAYAVKDKKFTKFDKSLSRVNQLLEIYIKWLWEQNLIEIQANAIYLGDEEESAKNTTYGLWLKDDVKLDGFDEWPEKGLRDVLAEPEDYQGEMLGNKYNKQLGKGKDRCAETINLLNHTPFRWDERVCEFEARPEEGETNKQAFEYYEGKVLKMIKVGEKFYICFAPDSRLRLYADSDVGNYIGLKQIRARIAMGYDEDFKPDAVED